MSRLAKWRRRAARLAQASPREVLFRLRAAGRTAVEYTRWRRGDEEWPRRALLDSLTRSRRADGFPEGAGASPDLTGEWLRERLRAQAGAHFYWDPKAAPGIAARCAALWPEQQAALLARAQSAREGRVDVFDVQVENLPEEVDWHADPVGGPPWPRRFWSGIQYLGDPAGRDVKYVWELSRHQHVFDLARAYVATGDVGFAAAARAWLGSWIAANPPYEGVNWASALEVAVRSMAWIWSVHLLLDDEDLDGGEFAAIIAYLRCSGDYIANHLSVYSSPNTHLLCQAYGLFLLGTYLPELAEAPAWRERGLAELTNGLRAQVRGDGFHFERSTCYHRYALACALHALGLAKATGHTVPDALGRAADGLLGAAVRITRPDGQTPALGDDDGGALLRFGERREDTHRGLLAAGALLLGNGQAKCVAGGISPEALWLAGPSAEQAWEALEATRPEVVATFPASGMVVARSEWGPEADFLCFQVGPDDSRGAGHGHADSLSVEIVSEGHPVVVDPGTGCYGRFPEWRDHFRSARAHSTLVRSGRQGPRATGLFEWDSAPRGRLEWVCHGAGSVLALGSRPGGGKGEARHRRAVLWLAGEYTLIVDVIKGEGVEPWEVGLQCAPGQVEAQGEGSALIRPAEGPAVQMLFGPGAADCVEMQVCEGSEPPLGGWISEGYGLRSPSPLIEVRGRSRLPASVASCLGAVGASGAPRAIRPLSAQGGWGWEVETQRGKDWLLIRQEEGGAVLAEGIETDAQGLLVRFDADGRAVSVLAAGGRQATVLGARVRLNPRGTTEMSLEAQPSEAAEGVER